jgi:2Fe-2S ferredoxin
MMTRITYIDHKGTARTVEALDGMSLMEVALHNHIPGIIGECGGACACATCHIYVEPPEGIELPEISAMEDDMLDFAHALKPNSRLACQILVKPELEGLVVRTPERQA